ncbi:MAG: 50S ribosomal protein L17 [Bacteroidales bacterium]|nr:50S ribosomal protein L17 [Candidatus Cacconaster scatequi]
MRHNRSINHLGRQSGHRKAMLSNMASSLILSKQIETTLAKAKALRSYVEPLITKSKEDTTHNRRTVFSYLKQKEAVSELFRVVAPKIADRPGGYTRIVKNGFREGDGADMAIMELVDFNESAAATPAAAAAKKPATRRSRAKKAEAAPVEGAAEGAEAPAKKAPAKKAPAKSAAPKASGKVSTKAAPAKKVQAPRKTGN